METCNSSGKLIVWGGKNTLFPISAVEDLEVCVCIAMGVHCGVGGVCVCVCACVVSYPDPDSHSCGWITSPLRGKRVWRTAVLNSAQ